MVVEESTNLDKLMPSRKPVRAGDVFALGIGGRYFHGRVVSTEVDVGMSAPAILAYVFETPSAGPGRYRDADLAAQHGDAAEVDLGTPWAESRLLASPTVHAALASLDHQLGAVEGPGTSTEEVREQARARGASVAAAYPGRGRGGSPS